MPLYLNTQKIEGHGMKVSATLPLAGQDMSGQSSYTDTAETGDKPKQLSVRMEVPFKKSAWLTTLLTLAEAKDDAGARVTYDIVNPTAKVMRIRQVKFQGDVSISEDETLKLWRVSFKLTEKRSVSELKESRQQAQAISDQQAAGTTVSDGTEAQADAVPTEIELSTFERFLATVEGWIGGDESSSA